MRTNTLPPIHPGEILREEFMKPRGLSLNGLARALNVLPRRVNEIVLEKRGISADTALLPRWRGRRDGPPRPLVKLRLASGIECRWKRRPPPSAEDGLAQ
jgi:addiction module HigA family antidote